MLDGSTAAAPGESHSAAPAHRHVRSPKRLRQLAHLQNDLIWTAVRVNELDLPADPNGGFGSRSDAGGHHGPRPGAGGPRRRQHLACPGSDPSGALICAEPGHGIHELSAAGARDLRAATRSRGGRQARPPQAAASMPDPEPKWPQAALGQHGYSRGVRARLLPDSRNRKRSPAAPGARNPRSPP